MSLQAVVELVDKMSAPLKSLTNTIGEFSKGLAEGAKKELELQKQSREAGKDIESLSTKVGDLGKALISLAAIGFIFEQFKQAVIAADALGDLSEKTGIAAESLRQYSFAATLSGTSIEGLIGALQKLERSSTKSEEETSKQAAAFEALGISASDTSGKLKSSEQLFGEIADKFKNLKDGPEKAAIAFALFGGKANELIPLLNKGSEGIAALKKEAEELGGMGADAFNAFTSSSGDLFDNIDKLKLLFTGFFSVLSAEVVPILNILIESFLESYKSGGMVAQLMEVLKFAFIGILVPSIKIASVIIRGFIDTLDILGKGIGAVAAGLAALASGDIEGAKAVWAAYKEDVAKVAEEHTNFADSLFNTDAASVMVAKSLENMGGKAKNIAPSISKVGTAAKEAKSEIEAFRISLEQELSGAKFGDAFKKIAEARAKLNADLKAGINPEIAQADFAKAIGLITDISNAKGEKLFKDEADRTQKLTKLALQENKIRDDALNMFPDDEAARKKYVEQQKFELTLRNELNALREKRNPISGTEASISAEEARIQQVITEIGLFKELAKSESDVLTQREEDAKKAEDITKDILSASNALILADVQLKLQIAGQMVEQGKITANDFLNYSANQLDRLKDTTKEKTDEITLFWQEAAKNIQSTMSSFFFDIMQGKLDNLGARFKNVLDKMVADALAANLANAMFGEGFTKTGNIGGLVATAGNFVSGLFSGARATGGSVEAGKKYMVGEKGPEPFIPSVNGTILPNSALKEMSSGNSISINITAMDSQDVRRSLEKDSRWIADLVNKSSRVYNLG